MSHDDTTTTPRTLTIPEFSAVVLIGASGAGKSTFAKNHFLPTEVLSSDHCRGLVCDDPNSQEATKDAFELLHYMLHKRLARRRLTVIDATNVQREARKPLVAIAREHHCLPVAIVLDMPASLCHERNTTRPDRAFGPHVVRNHRRQLKRSLKHLKREGFRRVLVIKSPEELESLTIERAPLWNDRRELHGPFDIIGDVHGCFEELRDLLVNLGYTITARESMEEGFHVTAPEGRKALFVGDLVDRGPATPEVLSLVMSMIEANAALCVSGNHDAKLLKALRGKKVSLKHGLDLSMEQLEACSEEFRARVVRFLDGLISHYMLADGKLCVAHAGLREDLQGRASGRVRSFALYGDTTGEVDGFGLPVRLDWAAQYRGAATVVYGHTPTGAPEWVNDTICIDTGCVFGGSLTALRWPERELVSVDARDTYAESARPLQEEQEEVGAREDMLDLRDVTGKRVLHTRLRDKITVRADQSAAALEVMSRWAVDPRWLIYLPPTMAPSETSAREGMLEHPDEALQSYRARGITEVICEEKHMGSRAVVIALKDPEVAKTRFGFDTPADGVIYTRTGRRFFKDAEQERAVLAIVREAMEASSLWDALETDWVCLDCELMPWSAKAQSLLRAQYAPVGIASRAANEAALSALQVARDRGLDVDALLGQHASSLSRAERFQKTWQHYCWPVEELSDYRLAPFHILASEGRAHFDREHTWHMKTLTALCEADTSGVLFVTEHRVVRLDDKARCEEVIRWWEELTAGGGEGMVIKPLDFIAHDERGRLVQPAVKCRGREYLRMIYGLDYTRPENLERLRERGLRRKRSLAIREFALGHEGLERFVGERGVRKVHECVFAILALESEPVDPRL